MTSPLKINQPRLIARLDELARVGALDGGGVTRLTFTDADKEGRDLLVRWMRELGLAVQIDRVGNIFGTRIGETDDAPVMFGSHIDTVKSAGTLDGCYGVLAALECVHTLTEQNIQTRRPLVVAAFTNEEGVRFTPGMLGSAVYIGELSVEQAWDLRGFDGTRFGGEIQRVGYDGTMEPGAIEPCAYLELHIEQGPLLDLNRVPIGAVDAVVGITWLEITVNGAANHAGTTPMDMRRDAGLAAAKIVTYLREIATTLGGNQRATCGMIQFLPNAINVIPSKAIFTVDLRNSDNDALQKAEAMLVEFVKKIETEDGVSVEVRALEHVLPVQFHPMAIQAVEESAQKLGLQFQRMVSGAGHDAQLMAHKFPSAMIFVPSREGISHSPKEYTPPEDLARGADVLLNAIVDLAN
ncbi:MAG: M20 family metallo-hydrolase [Chloroflexi bacterium]|nr:M20 family metallo-hydrolase [Chloroflexota bacterium]